MIGNYCSICGIPIFYDWVPYGGSRENPDYVHTGCFFAKERNETTIQSGITTVVTEQTKGGGEQITLF